MNVSISNPDKVIFEGDASLLQLPGADGSFEILDRHAPILSLLKKGVIRLVGTNGKEEKFEIEGGMLGMAGNVCRILLTA